MCIATRNRTKTRLIANVRHSDWLLIARFRVVHRQQRNAFDDELVPRSMRAKPFPELRVLRPSFLMREDDDVRVGLPAHDNHVPTEAPRLVVPGGVAEILR